MKRHIQNGVLGIGILLVILLLASCATQPNPLVGAWADNSGATLTLMADNSFMAKITNNYGQAVSTEGTYNVLLNVITFVTSSGHQRVTEWDIRGNMLYINWTDDSGKSVPLTLYKIRN